MITRSQRIKLVLFLVGTTSVAAALLVLFTRQSLFQARSTYYVRVPGSVSGIQDGSVVSVRGVRVGKVTRIVLYADDMESVRLVLDVDRDVPINRDAEATLAFQGVTGVKFVEIAGGSGEHGRLPPGSFIRYRESTLERVTDQAEQLVTQASDLLATTNELVRNVADVTSKVDLDRVETILADTQATVAGFERAAGELNGLIHESRAPLQRTLSSADEAFQGAGRATRDASAALDALNTTALELKNTVRQNEGHFNAIVYNLREASQSFKSLAEELRRKPSRLLLSSAPKERELP